MGKVWCITKVLADDDAHLRMPEQIFGGDELDEMAAINL
jgi:hypothetical protein